MLDLARQGPLLEQPLDMLKGPYVLDFMKLPTQARLLESDLESALIDQLQAFLLELGKGFAFEDANLYADLVFYNCT